jgi:hypothetical protein
LWQEKEVGYLLPKVWTRVFGLRKELYEFLELWAVGSMLGSTQIVDRRVLVVVLNLSLISEKSSMWLLVITILSWTLRWRRWALMRMVRRQSLCGLRELREQVGRILFEEGNKERTGDRGGWQRSKRED